MLEFLYGLYLLIMITLILFVCMVGIHIAFTPLRYWVKNKYEKYLRNKYSYDDEDDD